MALNRVLEPELMEDASQAKAYADADFGLSDQKFMEHLNQILGNIQKIKDLGLFLDLGCGPGNISHRLALDWPSMQVLGLDGSKAMLEIAESNRLDAYPLLENLSYSQINISSLADGSMTFEKKASVVVSNSFLHHLHNPDSLWKSLKRISAKASIHYHRDLRRPQSEEDLDALQKKYLANGPSVLVNDYRASLRAAFTLDEVVMQLKKSGLDKFAVREVDDRYLEVIGTM